ncbi:unnamed protein product [Caenorhabditis auriculariae]|uniref:Uncharacterized protein n=1 Tax=Caenorhabditis auriculariae TaxID=2777116 RepID=A0A8S1HKR1_9PELO|nr:unnamed protein product [Caenorhabditis auriculariae]
MTSLEVKEASLDRTLTGPQATYQRLGLGLHRPPEGGEDRSQGIRLGSHSQPALAGDSASDSSGGVWCFEIGMSARHLKPQSVRFNAALGVRRRPASIPARVSTGIHPVTSLDLKPSPLAPLISFPCDLGTLQIWSVLDPFL